MDEPMDVDLSSHSASVMDISYTSSNVDLSIVKTEPESADNDVIFVSEIENSFHNEIVTPETINKMILCKIQNRSTLVTRTTKSKRGPIFILSLLIIFISIFTYRRADFNCCERFDTERLRHSLTTKLYGQADAIHDFVKALDAEESRKIIVLYGGTGVGKTYTTSLMLENVMHYKNIYHYTMPSFLQIFSTELMLGLLFCKSAVLVLDDLTSNDTLGIKVPVKELLVKSESLSNNITIIFIYNCVVVNENFSRKCDENFPLEIKQGLDDLDAKKYFIRFKSLTEEHLRNCIENELADRKITAKNIDRIARHFNVTLDGCKGVHQKLQYMTML